MWISLLISTVFARNERVCRRLTVWGAIQCCLGDKLLKTQDNSMENKSGFKNIRTPIRTPVLLIRCLWLSEHIKSPNYPDPFLSIAGKKNAIPYPRSRKYVQQARHRHNGAAALSCGRFQSSVSFFSSLIPLWSRFLAAFFCMYTKKAFRRIFRKAFLAKSE